MKLLLAIWIFLFPNLLHSEQSEQAELNNLLSSAKNQTIVLSYSQSYLYNKKEPVQYTGTVYLTIASFHNEGCNLMIGVIVQDRYVGTEDQRQRFSGKIIHKETGQKVDSYRYTYQLSLKDIDPSGIDTVIGRPTQLSESLRLSCIENKSCALPWVHIKSALPVIEEQRIMNGFEDVKMKASQMSIPMTSAKTASLFVNAVRNATLACHPA
jgi:hypothetical protein